MFQGYNRPPYVPSKQLRQYQNPMPVERPYQVNQNNKQIPVEPEKFIFNKNYEKPNFNVPIDTMDAKNDGNKALNFIDFKSRYFQNPLLSSYYFNSYARLTYS
jgi:hypothetical protein